MNPAARMGLVLVATLAAGCTAPSSPEAPEDPASSAEASAPSPSQPAPVEGAPFQKGLASFYADKLTGRPTASGVPYDPALPTCAHKKLRLGTELEVLRLSNKRRARCVVNDRGPFHPKRVVDLSRSVAEALEIDGVAKVELRPVPDDARTLPRLDQPEERR